MMNSKGKLTKQTGIFNLYLYGYIVYVWKENMTHISNLSHKSHSKNEKKCPHRFSHDALTRLSLGMEQCLTELKMMYRSRSYI